MSTVDHEVERYGYRQEFERTIRSFTSFAVAFSFISITTGIFTTYAFLLNASGPKGIWTWAIVVAGQLCVALVFGALAAKLPLAGFSYQWASRLTNPVVGLFIGWISYSFLAIVVISVDSALVSVAIDPLFGITSGGDTIFNVAGAHMTNDVAVTIVVVAIQALIIIFSTRLVELINNAAVATEVVGIVGLTVLLTLLAIFGSDGSFHNLTSTGIVPEHGWYDWLGPVMLATLLGAYTIVGFETASNLSEETIDPRRVVPTAMWRSVALSGVLGMAFLIAVTVAMPPSKIASLSASSTPIADIINIQLGSAVEKFFLAFVVVSIFACGLIIYVSQSRLIWSMSRDERFPGYQVFRRVNRTTRTPANAVLLGFAVAVVLLLWFSSRLVDLFTASTQLPAMYYTLTVLLYLVARRKVATEKGLFSLGKWEPLVVGGALVWLVYELCVVFLPDDFHTAAKYTVGMTVIGVLWIGVLALTHRSALRSVPLELHDDAELQAAASEG